MSAAHKQGMLFIAVALFVSAYHVGIGIPDDPRVLPVLALMIVVLGIPHGALDTLVAGRAYRLRSPLQWAGFTMAYLAPVVAVMVAWPYWPAILLILFLAVSVGHFSGDLEGDCPRWIRFLYGGAPVVLPVLLHRAEVGYLFSFLAPGGEASGLLAALHVMAWPWLVTMGVGVALMWRRNRQSALEVAAVGTLCAVAPPLVSFTVFFCGMHSARHILRHLSGQETHSEIGAEAMRQIHQPSVQRIREAALAGLPPMAATLALLAVYWSSAGSVDLEPRLIQTVFVGLAALTFPHVILVDGLQRWRTS